MRTTILLAAVASAGCGGRAGAARFVPAPLAAKAALTAALDEWKKGRPTGAVEGASPAVQVVDETRPAGQRLLRFQILGEVPSDGARTFNVLLETENPAQRETVRYVVVGIEPLWVFRQQDYDKMAHWEMDMKHDDEAPEKPLKEPSDRRP